MKMYPLLHAKPVTHSLEWKFPSGFKMKFAHLEYDSTVLDYQGSALPWIGFDELTHFSKYQFLYMLSRNRSTSGVPGRIRATCNPDMDSWVRRDLVDWWIGKDGLPIKERSGVIRFFIVYEDQFVWADTRRELKQKYGAHQLPLSFTFIPSLIHDNKVLMEKDPTYLAKLHNLTKVERERLLAGNWNIRASAGNYFKREMFGILDVLPANPIQGVRYWDRAATEVSSSSPDPDWTAGCKMWKYDTGVFVVEHVGRDRLTPLKVEKMMRNLATQDTTRVSVCVEQEPGSAGVADAQRAVTVLQGFDVRIRKPTASKEIRAKPVSAQAEAGNIYLVKGDWNEAFLTELENFPPEKDRGHDDQVDAFSGAFNELCEEISTLDYYRETR